MTTFEEERDKLANFIKKMKTKEELNTFLDQLSAEYVRKRIPNIMGGIFGKK